MKQIINGKSYDTETASRICSACGCTEYDSEGNRIRRRAVDPRITRLPDDDDIDMTNWADEDFVAVAGAGGREWCNRHHRALYRSPKGAYFLAAKGKLTPRMRVLDPEEARQIAEAAGLGADAMTAAGFVVEKG